MGLHEYAGHRTQMAFDMSQGYGVPLVAGMLQKVEKMLDVLLKMQTNQVAKGFDKIIKP